MSSATTTVAAFAAGLAVAHLLRQSQRPLGGLGRRLLSTLRPQLSPPTAVVASLDTVIFDCDGVLYRGKGVMPGGPDALAALRRAGKRLLFVTNAATASRKSLAEKLTAFGYSGVTAADCVTSASAAAAYLAKEHPDVKRAYVVGGGAGLSEELALVGVEVLGRADAGKGMQAMIDEDWSAAAGGAGVGAVVVGAQPEGLGYACLAKAAAYAQDRSRAFVATNEDVNFPASFDVPLPAGGSLVALVASASERRPDVYVGKPSKDLARLVVALYGLEPRRALMVGDRCNTDVAFGRSVGMRTCLVLSGCHTRADACEAEWEARPEFVAESVVEIASSLT